MLLKSKYQHMGSNSNGAQQNIIAQDTKLIGNITSNSPIRIDGSLEGNLTTQGKVVVGKMGSIKGQLKGVNADIEGKFSGKIELTGTLVLKDTAHIDGEVIIGKLSVEPGATFNANCSMRGAIKSLGSEQRASGPQKDEKTA
jgi:cytoskeletal protein CcmA (bactofilin family)